MSCIREAYNLAASPLLYLYSGKKEKNFAASMFKTAAALALLAPGIILVSGCFALNILLSPCCGSAFKRQITSKPGEDQRKWEKAFVKLEENIKMFRLRESYLLDYFHVLPTNVNHPKMKIWRKDPNKYITKTPLQDGSSKNSLSIQKKYLEFPKHPGNSQIGAQEFSKDRKLFEDLLIISLSSCRHTCSQYLDLYSQERLRKLDRLQRAYYASALDVWQGLKRLYEIEKNKAASTLCAMRIQSAHTFSDYLRTKIQKQLANTP